MAIFKREKIAAYLWAIDWPYSLKFRVIIRFDYNNFQE